ncbi:helix-turn-helix transcriptional regulator [Streptomyces sp. NPDC088124]|uniref:helix-turn-helix domain-containing protein n=1 Tax=Streptomyces sp. NPDC088124 TaxID=3154654 RepID=UPI00343F9BE2
MPLRSNGAEIRRRRELMGMTLTHFAEKAGYCLNHASMVEIGRSNGGPKYLTAAAHILGCEIADITEPPRKAAA